MERSRRDLLPASHQSSLKICSFSATAESIIMWSHYADQHRGFCVEYDLQSLPAENLFVRMMYPVIYSEKLFDATRYYLPSSRTAKGSTFCFPFSHRFLSPRSGAMSKSGGWSSPPTSVKETVASAHRALAPKRSSISARVLMRERRNAYLPSREEGRTLRSIR